jgi:hypothetical protein
MTRTRTAALLFACFALLHARPVTAQTPEMPTLSVPSPPVVKVLSTGAEPRRVLRYTVAGPSKERVDMTMQMSLAMTMGDVSLPAPQIPAMHMGVNIDVTGVNAAGDISFTFGYADFTAEGAPLPGEIADMIKNATGSVTMSNRGIVKAMAFDAGASSNPMLKQLMSSAGIEKLSAPLPEEPLGVGARWEVEQALNIGGVTTTQKTIYELVSLDAASATMKLTLTQGAAGQKLTLPQMPPGADVSLISMDGTGSGTMVLKGGIFPLGDMDIRTKMVMDVSAEGETHRMSTETGMKITLAAGKR